MRNCVVIKISFWLILFCSPPEMSVNAIPVANALLPLNSLLIAKWLNLLTTEVLALYF